MQMKFNYYYYY